MRKDRLSVQVSAEVEALIEQLAAASCVRPAQMAAMLLAHAAQQSAAARGMPTGGPVPPAGAARMPVGIPADASHQAVANGVAASGQPAGGPADAGGKPAPPHPPEGFVLKKDSQGECEGERSLTSLGPCPECGGALEVRLIGKRNRVGCVNYRTKRWRSAALKGPCEYVAEIPVPSLARQGAEAKRSMEEAKTQRAKDEASGEPPPDFAEAEQRIKAAARSSPIAKRGGALRVGFDVNKIVPGAAPAATG
jgi:ssDNA-binding Zn-finger/Zn-ribbon topoisomerase 1